MTTPAYVQQGKWVTDRLAPINAIMFITTGILVPVMDIFSPRFPFKEVALVLAVLVAALALMKWLKVPARLQLPNGLLLSAMFCAAIFGASAFASYKYEHDGGVLASKVKGLADLQRVLLQIRDGQSDDPRVELAARGMRWSVSDFREASARGDLWALERYVLGGMPQALNSDGQSIAYFIVATNPPSALAQLQLLQKHGYDLNARSHLGQPGRYTPPNLYGQAMEYRHEEVAKSLLQLGVQEAGYAEWKAKQPRGNTSSSYMF